jgi:hypothetical protein
MIAAFIRTPVGSMLACNEFTATWQCRHATSSLPHGNAGMREAREGEVAFHDVDSSVLRAFLQFLYACSTTVQVSAAL